MKNSKQHHFVFFFLQKFPFKTFFLVALIIIAWLFINRDKLLEFWQAYQTRNAELARVQKLEYEMKQLEQKRTLLEQTTLETERLVREKFKMKKPGEKIIILK
ncbi:hypothetical protein J7M23_01755 [Candidatus Sumerlaeota bacterium]|nr:hypothetical protein [Candidatus Sumerlaeota bacterium]